MLLSCNHYQKNVMNSYSANSSEECASNNQNHQFKLTKFLFEIYRLLVLAYFTQRHNSMMNLLMRFFLDCGDKFDNIFYFMCYLKGYSIGKVQFTSLYP